MARIKYYYDTETCKYERIKVSKWDIVLNSLGFLTISLLLSIGLVFIFNKYFESPKEILLKKENSELKLHFDILDKEMSDVKEMLSILEDRDDNVYRVIFEGRLPGKHGSNHENRSAPKTRVATRRKVCGLPHEFTTDTRRACRMTIWSSACWPFERNRLFGAKWPTR